MGTHDTAATPVFDLQAYLARQRDRVEPALVKALASSGAPEALRRSMEYSLLAGGKRLRPALVIAAAELEGLPPLDPLPAACAVEFVHTYSLIHDDLPAMDDDDFRRGRPTSHKVFGEALAILAGDALLTEAFGLIAYAYGPVAPTTAAAVSGELARAAGAAGMVGGQVLDTVNTGASQDAMQMELTHRMKTGALIAGSLRIGGVIGGASEELLAGLECYGRELGLTFQIVDDLLDVTGDLATLGKTPGTDERLNKLTYPRLHGMDGSRRMARAACDRALAPLGNLGESAEPLRAIARYVLERSA